MGNKNTERDLLPWLCKPACFKLDIDVSSLSVIADKCQLSTTISFSFKEKHNKGQIKLSCSSLSLDTAHNIWCATNKGNYKFYEFTYLLIL